MARRQHLSLILVFGLVAFFSLTWFMSSSGSSSQLAAFEYDSAGSVKKGSLTPMAAVDFGGLDGILTGGSIAPKLGNETLKYVHPCFQQIYFEYPIDVS